MTQVDILARKITKKNSLQTYLIIKVLVDRGMVDDAYKAYAYFRWLDDEIDINLKTLKERRLLIKRQSEIITSSYKHRHLFNLTSEEKMICSLISKDIQPESKLKSYIYKFFSVIAFDAERGSRTASEKEINWYSKTIGEAVTDCIQYFVGNANHYPDSPDKYKAATAAHIVHSLRDFKEDLSAGLINIPKEYLKKHGINTLSSYDGRITDWVKNRVSLARRYFAEGKGYINLLPVSRCKLVAKLYCLRFEPLLSIIEKDNYLLRQNYDRKGLAG